MISIAIDGPAGAGKSTICDAVAKALGFVHVDTGALYRAIGVCALRKGVDTTDWPAVIALLPETRISLKFTPQGQRIFLGEEDVSEAIRLPEASMAASNVSAIPEVRAFLMDLQRDLARRQNVIMDGRDIGTVVLPGADLKIFLTASPEVRALRRLRELEGKGHRVDYDALLAEVKERDYQDSHREAAPLRQAEDAWLCDTTDLDFHQSVDAIIHRIKECTGL